MSLRALVGVSAISTLLTFGCASSSTAKEDADTTAQHEETSAAPTMLPLGPSLRSLDRALTGVDHWRLARVDGATSIVGFSSSDDAQPLYVFSDGGQGKAIARTTGGKDVTFTAEQSQGLGQDLEAFAAMVNAQPEAAGTSSTASIHPADEFMFGYDSVDGRMHPCTIDRDMKFAAATLVTAVLCMAAIELCIPIAVGSYFVAGVAYHESTCDAPREPTGPES